MHTESDIFLIGTVIFGGIILSINANVLSTARMAAYEADLPSEGPAHLFDDPFHCSFCLCESRSQYVQFFVPYSTGPNGFKMSLFYN